MGIGVGMGARGGLAIAKTLWQTQGRGMSRNIPALMILIPQYLYVKFRDSLVICEH